MPIASAFIGDVPYKNNQICQSIKSNFEQATSNLKATEKFMDTKIKAEEQKAGAYGWKYEWRNTLAKVHSKKQQERFDFAKKVGAPEAALDKKSKEAVQYTRKETKISLNAQAILYKNYGIIDDQKAIYLTKISKVTLDQSTAFDAALKNQCFNQNNDCKKLIGDMKESTDKKSKHYYTKSKVYAALAQANYKLSNNIYSMLAAERSHNNASIDLEQFVKEMNKVTAAIKANGTELQNLNSNDKKLEGIIKEIDTNITKTTAKIKKDCLAVRHKFSIGIGGTVPF